MALGVGVGAWNFSSPDFPQGAGDYGLIAGDGQGNPFVLGPQVGGDANTTVAAAAEASGVGPVHVSTGQGGASPAGGRAQHWSNLLDWRSGPMFWLAVATILYFGLISAHVGARAGHFKIGAGSSR